MPLLLEQPQLIAVLLFGVLGAGAAAAGVFYLAASWKKRAGFAYGLSAFVFYVLVFIATFQHGLLNSEIGPDAATWMLTVLILGQALVTSVGVAVFTLLVFAAWLMLLGELDFPVNRIKSYAGCAVFCFAFSSFLNPIGAVRQTDDPSARSIYEEALSSRAPEAVEAARREAARTLQALREIGALLRIDATEAALVHHVKGQFIDLSNAEVEEYMRAALVHHIYAEGGKLKPVILREAGSNREIARREPNGQLRRHASAALPQGEQPPGG
jgi:signal transduction histidine kinase